MVVLATPSFVDLGAVAASWNVHQDDPSKIDLCYLDQVGDGAILPLIALERRPMDAVTRDRVRYVRSQLLTDLAARQESWMNWTPHGARRLARARATLGSHVAAPHSLEHGAWRNCDGSIESPPMTAGRP